MSRIEAHYNGRRAPIPSKTSKHAEERGIPPFHSKVTPLEHCEKSLEGDKELDPGRRRGWMRQLRLSVPYWVMTPDHMGRNQSLRGRVVDADRQCKTRQSQVMSDDGTGEEDCGTPIGEQLSRMRWRAGPREMLNWLLDYRHRCRRKSLSPYGFLSFLRGGHVPREAMARMCDHSVGPPARRGG
jgi:hypothetical protein